MSVNLYTAHAAIGALDPFFSHTREFGSEDLETVKVLGAHASVVLARYRSDSDLWKAIDGRHCIGMAQSMLIQRFKIIPERSFALLRRYPQQQNVKLRVIADRIVATGVLPDSIDGGSTTVG